MTTVSLGELGSERRRAAFPARAVGLYLGGGTVAVGVYFALPSTAQDVLYAAIGLSAVAAIYVGAVRRLDAGRLAWHCFAVGLLCEVAGDTISSFYELALGREPPVPSVADAFYLGGYPLLALGIFMLLRERVGATTFPAVLDTVIVFVAVATVQWIFFVEPYDHVALGAGARAVSMAYPSADVLLLVGLAQLLIGVKGRRSSYRLLVGSVALWVVGDEIYALTVGHYSAGGWVDTFWLGSYVVWGGAALASPGGAVLGTGERRAVPRLTGARLGLLAAALLAGPASLIVDQIMHERPHPVAAAIGAALIAALVLLRLSGLVRALDRARLHERQSRMETELAGRRIQTQNAELRELDRLKDEFVSSLSHELRTPLTSITGYVELLLEETEDAETRKHLEVVRRNAARLLGLVSDLLFAARLQSSRLELRLEPVDLRMLVEQAVVSARPHAELASVALNVHAEDVPPVDGEGDRLAQLLDNLVSNAIKFTPAGGAVDISLAARNGGVCIEVSDTGIGISEDDGGRLFERFFRTPSVLESQIPGTGLGLYISKAIVEAHRGRIAVRSAEGRGTTFVVEMPAAGSG
jgi:signal transduction histidine kinase